MVDIDSMGPGLQLVGARFSNFLLGKLSRESKLRGMSIFHEIQMAIISVVCDTTVRWLGMLVVLHAGLPIVYVDLTFTRSNVKVKVTGLLKFRKSPRWPRLQPRMIVIASRPQQAVHAAGGGDRQPPCGTFFYYVKAKFH